MGPDSTDLTFIVIGSIMIIAGCVLYLAMQIWTNLRDADPTFPAAASLTISFGITVATNGLVVGYTFRMPTAMSVTLAIIMLVSFVWTCFNIAKLYKLTYGKTKSA